MLRKHLFYLLLLLLAAPQLSKASTSANKVRFEVHFAPNFISSIYSVGEIGFLKSPELMYVDMSAADKKTLQKARELFEFGNGKCGRFTFPVYFLPCYYDISSAAEYKAYVSELKKALRTNSYKEFLKRYPVNFDDVFMKGESSFFNQSQKIWEKQTQPKLDELFEVLDIFAKYASEYEQRFWKDDKRSLEKKADFFNQYFEKEDIIGRWEQLLNKSFNGDYHIYLCRHNSYGPDANSICFDRNIFCAYKYENRVIDFVSHEVATHLFYEEAFLSDSLASLREQNEEVFYAATESLAMFLNGKLLGKKLSYEMKNFRGAEFCEIYEKAYQSNSTVSVEALLREGVSQMIPRWKR